MANTCEKCGSLIVHGKCTNGRCGTGNHVRWAGQTPPRLASALANKNAPLVTAVKGTRASDREENAIRSQRTRTEPVASRDPFMAVVPEAPDMPGDEASVGLDEDLDITEVPESRTCAMSRLTEAGLDGFSEWECSKCHGRWEWHEDAWPHVGYCPDCGRKVVLKDTMPLPKTDRQ